ncbi:hypothetical protein [Halobacteriovorax sp.]|uniref:hypothetical protein n=1 Tax=Halobacteriovorax sp. TaxID=2020862 RepID=UPI0035683403
MFINSWLAWLGLFTTITILLVSIRGRVKTRKISGHFDQSIYSKPMFKGASIFIIVLIAIMLFIRINN